MRFNSRDDFENEIIHGLGENVIILVAKHKGATHACLVVPFSNFSGYSWYGGTVAEPTKGAMHLLHWEVLRRLHHIGVRQFNFTSVRINPTAGTKQEGIATFKMRFGGALTQGYMWKYCLKPVKFALYSAAVRFLKGGDVVDRERHKMTTE